MSEVNQRAARRIGRRRARREGERIMQDALQSVLDTFADLEAASQANREWIDVMREARGISPIEWSRDV